MTDKKKEIPYGYCHCGCGGNTNLEPQNYNKRGIVKGEPKKYIKGHHWVGVNRSRENNAHWKGGEYTYHSGHVMVYRPNHPHAMNNGYIKRSRDVVENELGYILPKEVIIHHKNHVRDDDYMENLHVFKSHKEHAVFHQNEIAKEACGHSDWRKCKYCHQYDAPENMYFDKSSSASYHIRCKNKRRRKLNATKRKPASRV